MLISVFFPVLHQIPPKEVDHHKDERIIDAQDIIVSLQTLKLRQKD